MTEEFGDPEGLRVAVTRQLHRLELSQQQVGAADPEEMQIRAMHLVPGDERNSSKDALVLAVAGGPRQAILRPTNIESSDLYDELLQQASFGQHRVFDTRHGTERVIRDDALGEIPDGSHVVIDLSHTRWIDHDVREILQEFMGAAKSRDLVVEAIGHPEESIASRLNGSIEKVFARA